MDVTKFAILFAACFLFFFMGHIQAQAGLNLNTSDLSQVRSSDISDIQLQTFIQRAKEEGISMEQAFQLARQRGLSSSEAQELRRRIMELDTVSLGEEREREASRAGVDGEIAAYEEFNRPEREETEIMRRTFGSKIFRQMETEFTPTFNVPTPVNYTLGPGDEVTVSIWGDQTNTYRLLVSPEGTVDIENLGPVYVNGLTLQEANVVIIQYLQELYNGLGEDEENQTTFARVSLDRLRSIQVAMIGEVTNPGDYAIPSNSTVFNALYRAGGPAENGSYREIRVIRNNVIVAELDLYNFLVDGLQKENIRLRDQDVIQVTPYKGRVVVDGELKRDGLIFEVMKGESIADLIRFAGGFTDRAYTSQVRIHRNTDKEREILTVNREAYRETPARNGDVLYVDEILGRFKNRVSITGAVWRSGEFELREGMLLTDLIAEADGVRPDAFLSRGLINRMQDDYSFEQISFDVAAILENPHANNITLKREDHIIIRSIHEMAEDQIVEIGGAVQNSGEYYFRDDMILEDLILKAKGFVDSASEGRIEISRRIIGEATPEERNNRLAEIFTFQVNRDLSLRESDLKFELEPFDRVFVHQRPNYREQQTVTVEGEVLYPGTYTIRDRNERISDVIKRAGGVTDEAYLAGGRLVRQISSIDRPVIDLDFLSTDEQINREQLGFGEFEDAQGGDREENTALNENDSEGKTLEQRRAEINRSDTSRRISQMELFEQRRESSERRIGVDLETILGNPGSDDDLFIRHGDVIRIPEQLQTVAVSGAVMQSVEVRYQPGRSYSYYINRAGGYAEDARSGRGYVVYANGDVDRRKRYIFGLIKNSPSIEPGAQIIIPEKPERDRLSTGEIVSISSAIVGMSTTLLIAIDRIRR